MAVPFPGRLVTLAVTMNDFPVIGDLVMRTGLWDRQGANIANRCKEMYGKDTTFNGETTPRHTFLCSDSQIFAPR